MTLNKHPRDEFKRGGHYETLLILAMGDYITYLRNG